MSRKLVIVARDNLTLYESLKRNLGKEPDVEIVFDRRRAAAGSASSGGGVKNFFSREPRRASTSEDRRRRAAIDEQIRTQGWAIVRDGGEGLQIDQGAADQYKKLLDVGPMPEKSDADRVGTILLDHNGVCFECLAASTHLSLNDVMVSVRRMQVEFLLAFTTRACEICTRKSLVGYVRERYVLDERLDR